MTIKTLYNSEQISSSVRNAMLSAQAMDNLKRDMALIATIENSPTPDSEHLAKTVAKPLFDAISTPTGLAVAKSEYEKMLPDLSWQAQVTAMTILDNAPDEIQGRATDMLSFCMQKADPETRQEAMAMYIGFTTNSIEKGNFNPEKADTLLAVCDEKTQNYLFETMKEEGFKSLAHYAYEITVPENNTKMAIVKNPNDPDIPYDIIEDDRIRQLCMDNEREIRQSVAAYNPKSLNEILDTLEEQCAQKGRHFDREEEIHHRTQLLRDEMAGMTRDDHLERFMYYTSALTVLLNHQKDTPQPSSELNAD